MNSLLEKYSIKPDELNIDGELNSIQKNLNSEESAENYNICLGAIDLTSLHSTDTQAQIAAMASKVNKFKGEFPEYPLPASICVYPNLAKTVKDNLKAAGVHVTAVAGCFPTSQSFPEVKELECRRAVKDGADEIDIVLALNAFMAGELDRAADEIKLMRKAVGSKILKVILETGALNSVESIATASLLAMESGADFIKTSTGKMEPAATPMAAIVMCKCIKAFYEKTGKKIGFKAAGGIVTPNGALCYLTIVKSVLGNDWTSPKLFRLGASRLANNILSTLKGETVNYY